MRRFRNVGLSAAAVALATTGIVAVFAMPASANSAKPHGKVVCTTMSGSVQSLTITISGCTGNAVPGTGGGSMPLSITTLANGGPVTWVNNNVTTFGQPTLTNLTNVKKCPGYVKPTKTNPKPSEPSEMSFTGAVTADNTGMKVPGKYKGYVCIKNDSAGTFSAPKPLKIN